MPKIVLARPMVEAGMKVLAARKDVTLDIVEDVTPANIRAALKDADGIIFRPANYQFSDPELDVAPKLKVVCRVGVGYDSIDVPALTRRGVQMATVGMANAVTVAEHAIALMMGVGRKLVLFDKAMRDGSGYTVRFDEEPASAMRTASAREDLITGITFIDQDFAKALGAKRVRLSMSTAAGRKTEEDIDLTGIKAAHDAIVSGKDCR